MVVNVLATMTYSSINEGYTLLSQQKNLGKRAELSGLKIVCYDQFTLNISHANALKTCCIESH